MASLCGRVCLAVTSAVLAASICGAVASEQAFPFERELMLDVRAMPGSKRIPIIEVAESGAVSIDLWCGSASGQATVGREGSITIVPGEVRGGQCTPERQSGDNGLLAAITQVTNWRRIGDIIELQGPTTLRFRLMTN